MLVYFAEACAIDWFEACMLPCTRVHGPSMISSQHMCPRIASLKVQYGWIRVIELSHIAKEIILHGPITEFALETLRERSLDYTGYVQLSKLDL